MRIHPQRAEDAEAVRRLLERAFKGPDEAVLVEALMRDGDAVVALVAEEDAVVVGHVLLSRLDAPCRALALAPLSVDPKAQRRGTGSALVRAAIDAATVEGFEAIFVLGDPAWYERFGFDAGRAAPFASPYAGPHFMALALGGAVLPRGGEVRHARAFGRF